MKIQKTSVCWQRLTSLAVLTGVITLGCAVSASLKAKGVTPVGSGAIEIDVTIDPDGTKQADITGGSAIADKCVEVTFSDATGADIGTSTVSVGSSGSFSLPIPSGAVRLEGSTTDCPEVEEEEEEEEESPGMAAQSTSWPSASGGIGKPFSTRLAFKAPLNSFEVFGFPLTSDLLAGSEHAHYSFTVLANSHQEARAIIRPIVDGGVGTKVPGSVTIIKFTTITVDPSGGARIVSAIPGQFTTWTFDFNNGAFYADLFSRSIRYQHNNWDVVEVLIPASAFDSGILPGVTYVNGGVESYAVDYLPGVKESAWTIDATIL